MFRNGIRYGVLGLAALFGALASAAEIKVMNSGGFTAAYKDLAPGCERTTGNTVATAWGASMGTAPDAIPMRLARGEPADVLIMAAPALDRMITEGKAMPGSRVDLARSSIAMAVRGRRAKARHLDRRGVDQGAPRGPVDRLFGERQRRLSVERGSCRAFPAATASWRRAARIMSERVGSVVARGDAEIGFQQLSELIPIEGIDIVGPLPAELQRITVFSAGVAAGAKEPDAARALIACLAAPDAAPAISKSGLEPVARAALN